MADPVKTLEIGEKAVDFVLPGTDGRNYSLGDFDSAEILVIIFTCNHCPTAQAYEDRIMQLVNEYRDKGVTVVAVSPNDPEAVRLDELGYSDMGDTLEDMKLRVKEKGYNFIYLYDGETQKMSRAYGPVATPHVFVFDRERTLRYCGRFDDSEKIGTAKTSDAINAIDALLAGRPVPVEKTKLFGCSIKWSEKRDWVRKGFEDWAKEDVNLELIDEEGMKKLISNDSGNLRMINVWSTMCGPCMLEFPELININRIYRGREFELVTVSADAPEKMDRALAFLKKQQASCTNYIFASSDKYKMMEALDSEWPGALPYTLLVAPGGEVIFRHADMIEPLELKKEIIKYLGRYYD